MRSSVLSKCRSRHWILFALLVAGAFILGSCAANQSGKLGPDAAATEKGELKQIHTVTVTEDDQNTILTIAGSADLLFSDIRKSAPPAVSFYFPGTELVDLQEVYHVDLPPIQDIHTSEVMADGHTAKVTVNLVQDAAYTVKQSADGLTVAFSRDVLIEEKDLATESATAGEAPVSALSETIDPEVLEAASKGTCIEMVEYNEQSNGVEILILADGTITDYSAFTVDNPPRIVFDIYDISSPYKGLQKIEVASKWVQGVRHFCYPEKLRVVLDTDRSYLTTFTSKPIKNGLLISVAESQPILDDALVQTVAADTAAPVVEAPVPVEAVVIETLDTPPADSEPPAALAATDTAAPVIEAPVPAEAVVIETLDTPPADFEPPVVAQAPAAETAEPASEVSPTAEMPTAPAETEANAAWLNKLEFTSVEEGASIVSIGTTAPVRYDMERLSDRKLQLKLFNTRIPDYRKRPLITTRFKSAVDRITPIETDPSADHALVVFELREGVPFEMAQVNNFINIRFAPSAVPPKPLETATAPEWKQALEGTAEEEAGDAKADAPAAAQAASMADDDKSFMTPRFLAETTKVDGENVRPPKAYTGEKIALNFFDTDVRNVFRIIGEISGQNFAIDKNVAGRVTLQFDKPVPWDQVLDLVLTMNQLGLREEQGIYRIATQATLAREEQLQQQKLEARREASEAEELITEFLPLSYINARETCCNHLVVTCKADVIWASKFSPRGFMSVDEGKNMIIVNEVPSAIERVRAIVRILDQVTPQVLIESRIVEATSDFRRDVGFDWGTIAIGQFDLGDTFTVTGIDFEADNIPADALDNGAIEWGLSKISGTSFDIIDARIQVGETEGKTRTISAPKILTLDGKAARIQQGFQIPYLERDSAGGSSVEFQDVDLELSVTPNVTPDERVLLVVDIKKDDVIDISAAQPPLSTNSVHTELLMEDGETVVIGGVMKANTSEAGEGIPGLRKIPALGFFFGFSNKQDIQNELLIFLTPEIVQLAQKEIAAKKLEAEPYEIGKQKPKM